MNDQTTVYMTFKIYYIFKEQNNQHINIWSNKLIWEDIFNEATVIRATAIPCSKQKASKELQKHHIFPSNLSLGCHIFPTFICTVHDPCTMCKLCTEHAQTQLMFRPQVIHLFGISLIHAVIWEYLGKDWRQFILVVWVFVQQCFGRYQG